MTDLLELTEKLCAIPSVSGNESELAELVEGALRGGAPHLEVTRIGANVIARTHGGTLRVAESTSGACLELRLPLA